MSGEALSGNIQPKSGWVALAAEYQGPGEVSSGLQAHAQRLPIGAGGVSFRKQDNFALKILT